MLIEEIKKANMEALKAHDANKRAILSIVISRYQNLLTSGTGLTPGDAEVLALIQKVNKELDEEKESYEKAGRPEQAQVIALQKEAISAFQPKQLSEEEIRKIYAGLADKAMPSVMKYFKLNYAGRVDMALVSRIARGQ